jgi:hypothetical protein
MLRPPEHWLGHSVTVPEDLAQVPAITFQDQGKLFFNRQQFDELRVQQSASIRELEKSHKDGFWKTLLAKRADLAGLPVLMGDACRMQKENCLGFKKATILIRNTLDAVAADERKGLVEDRASSFWTKYSNGPEASDPPTVAALMQIFAVESVPMRLGLAKYLATVPHTEATQALARLAVFAPEPMVRRAAILGLKGRAAKDTTEIFLAGLRYPWPPIAEHAATAIVALDRKDLLPQLVAMLDEADPRSPYPQKMEGKETLVLKQLVRLNHNENCLLCHAPVDKSVPADVLVAPMPGPADPLPGEPTTNSYNVAKNHPSSELFVRLDVTYLRQDFSLLQITQSLGIWAKQQRFDFLVRTINVTPEQAQSLQQKLQKAHISSPYQEALLSALRELTGQDAAPTAAAWRKALKLGDAR